MARENRFTSFLSSAASAPFQFGSFMNQLTGKSAQMSEQAKYNREAAELSQMYNEQNMRIQQRYFEKNRDYDNWYNSPEHQMEMLRAAGLNPNLAYGNLSEAGSGSAFSPTASSPAVNPVQADYANPLAEAGQIFQMIMGMQSTMAQVDNLKASAAKTMKETDWIDRMNGSALETSAMQLRDIRATAEGKEFINRLNNATEQSQKESILLDYYIKKLEQRLKGQQVDMNDLQMFEQRLKNQYLPQMMEYQLQAQKGQLEAQDIANALAQIDLQASRDLQMPLSLVGGLSRQILGLQGISTATWNIGLANLRDKSSQLFNQAAGKALDSIRSKLEEKSQSKNKKRYGVRSSRKSAYNEQTLYVD